MLLSIKHKLLTLNCVLQDDSTITSHDGSYLAELLLTKGYAVHGIKLALIEACRVNRVPRMIFLGSSHI